MLLSSFLLIQAANLMPSPPLSLAPLLAAAAMAWLEAGSKLIKSAWGEGE